MKEVNKMIELDKANQELKGINEIVKEMGTSL